MTVAVIFGGRSGEHEVSLMSARSVLGALSTEKYDVVEIGIDLEGHWWAGEGALEAFERGHVEALESVFLRAEPGDAHLYRWVSGEAPGAVSSLDVVFPVLHGTFGEDGTLQGLLELADVAYVGAGVLASAVCMDKGLFKQVMRANGIAHLEFALIESESIANLSEAALQRAESVGDYPLFTKPANLGSSVGVTKCQGRSDLVEGLMEAAQYDRRVLVEKGIDARELEVSVLGNEAPEASVVGEIVPSDEFYTYRAKYVDDASELLIPAPIDANTADRAQRMALEAYRAVDGAGMARVDFLLERSTGELFLNEMNTIPGFTRISMYPKLWEASGLPYPQLCDRLIELALTRQGQKDQLVRQYGGAS